MPESLIHSSLSFAAFSPERYSTDTLEGSTQVSSFGFKIVVRILARAMLTRKFGRTWVTAPALVG